MPGPPPKPTAVRKLEGNPAHRSLNTDEPQPDATMPDAPDDLLGVGRDAWERLASKMHGCGILTQIDGDGLESYCRIYAEAKACWKSVRETGGSVIVNDEGELKRNPHMMEARRLEELLLKLRNELGLNATSRSKIKVDTGGKVQDVDEFLRFTG